MSSPAAWQGNHFTATAATAAAGDDDDETRPDAAMPKWRSSLLALFPSPLIWRVLSRMKTRSLPVAKVGHAHRGSRARVGTIEQAAAGWHLFSVHLVLHTIEVRFCQCAGTRH